MSNVQATVRALASGAGHMFAAATYKSVTIDLCVSDRMVLYSDGVTEFENGAGESFGEDRLH